MSAERFFYKISEGKTKRRRGLKPRRRWQQTKFSKKMDYFSFQITCQPELTDALIAFSAEQDFDTFEETETGFNAYLPAKSEVEQAEQFLKNLQADFDFQFEKKFHPSENWNERWESNFQPVIVEDWCGVRADFHPSFDGSVQHELLIQPKMAFGTGHHETTWMCLHALKNLPVAGQNLLDFGCGTGILAILAARLGAAHIEAIDIEQESFENTLENAAKNGVAEKITARCGILRDDEGTDFDGILANINRNVILDSLPRLSDLIRSGGWLLVSGILREDEKVVVEAAAAAGFQQKTLDSRGNWLCILFEK